MRPPEGPRGPRRCVSERGRAAAQWGPGWRADVRRREESEEVSDGAFVFSFAGL